MVGKGEDDMGVAGGQQFPAARLEPAVARVGLALRTMPVATRVEGDGAMPAAGTVIDVTAERGGPATDDGSRIFRCSQVNHFRLRL